MRNAKANEGTSDPVPGLKEEKKTFVKVHETKHFCLTLCSVLASHDQEIIERGWPTLASAMSNLTPTFTFILAIIFRMERLRLRSTNTQAKVMATLVSISGALVVVLYKGPTILSTTSERDWVKGGLLLTVGYLLFSAWSILQVISKSY